MEDKDGKVKDGWKKKSSEEIAEVNAKSTINSFNIAGIVIVIAGVIIGLFTSWGVLVTNVALGFIVMGIGEILRYLNKISNRA